MKEIDNPCLNRKEIFKIASLEPLRTNITKQAKHTIVKFLDSPILILLTKDASDDIEFDYKNTCSEIVSTHLKN